MRLRWFVWLGLVILGCSSEPAPAPSVPASQTQTPRGTATPPKPEKVALDQIARLEKPVALAVRGGDPALYIAEQTGRVRAVRPGSNKHPVVLDLSGEVSSGYEQGLLGLTFSPDGARMYVDYTDLSGDTQVVEYAFEGGRAVPSSRRVILSVDQPYANHNGGAIAFGPDGYLYIALGDGGSADDPSENGQSLRTLLGKILRIDPLSGSPYASPRGNPFVGRDDAQSEIWAYGLRNPWRFTFDRDTGDMWIGDVGQGAREEIDLHRAGARAGANFGWDRMEGTVSHEGSEPANHVGPVHEYPLTSGACAVVGGYVYRGSAIAGFQGTYVFGDNCRSDIMQLRMSEGRAHVSNLGIDVDALSSFGEDAAGELYALSLAGPVYRLIGV